MAVEIKRVSYTYNSGLEAQGVPAYFFDCLICRDGETLVDRHESFKTREEFYEALESVVPLVSDEVDWDSYADHWQYQDVEDL